ncbi:MAG: AsmA family protein [Chthoniobacterales bacterium]
MKKFARPILIVPAVFLLLIALVYIIINVYIQSGSVQTRIQATAAEALGGPVTISGCSLTPWSGFSLYDIELRDPGTQEPLFQAKRLRFRIPLLPLLSQRIEIKSATLLSPSIAWNTARSTWRFPSPKSKPKPIPDPDAPEKTGLKGPSYSVDIKSARIVDGSISIFSGENRLVAQADKVNLRSSIQDIEKNPVIDGTLQSQQLNIQNRFYLHNIKATFRFEDEVFNITPLLAEIADGKLEANARIDNSTKNFNSDLNITNASVPILLKNAGVPSQDSKGTAQAMFDFSGKIDDRSSWTGDGRAELIESQLRPVEFIRQLGQLFQIDELQLLDLDKAFATFELRDENIFVSELVMKSENLQILSQGKIGLQGNLDMPSRLLLNQELQRNLKALVGKALEDAPEEGYRQISFAVNGTLSNPKTDLLDKLTGVKIGGQIGNILQNIFALPSKKKD